MKLQNGTNYPNLYSVNTVLFSNPKFNLKEVLTQVEKEIKDLPENKKDEVRKKKIEAKRDNLLKQFGLDPNNLEQMTRFEDYLAIDQHLYQDKNEWADKNQNRIDLFKILTFKEIKELELNKIPVQFDNKLIDQTQNINAAFDDLNIKYQNYFNEEDRSKYEEIFNILFLVSYSNETNPNLNEVAEYAYKMMILFGKEPDRAFNNFTKFVQSHASNLQKPIHDVFIHNIPVKGECNIEAWKIFMMKSGVEVLKNIENAPKIEKKLNGNVPKNLNELQEILPELTYNRFKENPKMAKIFKQYDVSEKIFDRSLDLIASGQIKIKDKDALPNVTIDVAQEVNPEYKNLYLVKLPEGNLRGLILGKITDCCQSINGNSETCVIDGMTRENNGFYVLIKANPKQTFDPNKIDWNSFEKNGHEIIGQGYTWLSQFNNMVIDSWENLRPTVNDTMMPDILAKFAQKVTENNKTVSMVMLGKGGKTPQEFADKGYTMNPFPDKLKEGYMYGDARNQYILYKSHDLSVMQSMLLEIPKFRDKKWLINSFRNIREAKYFIELYRNGELSKSEFRNFSYSVAKTCISEGATFENMWKLYKNSSAQEYKNKCVLVADYMRKGIYNFCSMDDFFSLEPNRMKFVLKYAIANIKEKDRHYAESILYLAKTLDDKTIENLNKPFLLSKHLRITRDFNQNFFGSKYLDPKYLDAIYSEAFVKLRDYRFLKFEEILNLGPIYLIENQEKVEASYINNFFKDQYIKNENDEILAESLTIKQKLRLLNPNIIESFKNNIFNLNDINQIGLDKIFILSNPIFLNIFKNKTIEFKKLAELKIETLKVLSESSLIENFKENEHNTFNKLTVLSPDQIEAIELIDAIYIYNKLGISFDNFINVEPDKIRYLLPYINAEDEYSCVMDEKYQTKYIYVDETDIKTVPDFIVSVLEKSKISFEEIIGLDEKILRNMLPACKDLPKESLSIEIIEQTTKEYIAKQEAKKIVKPVSTSKLKLTPEEKVKKKERFAPNNLEKELERRRTKGQKGGAGNNLQ